MTVFISYAREDQPFAQLVCGHIERAGFSTARDWDLRGGDNWREEIDTAIRGADAVVVIMSVHARNSPYVSYEWAFALGADLLVIPLLIGISPDELHPALRSRHVLNFTDPMASPWGDLLAALQEPSGSRRRNTVSTPRSAPPVVREAARGLDSLHAGERQSSIQALKQTGHPSALEVLAAALQHPFEDVRAEAALALADLKDPRSIPEVLEAVRRAQDPAKFGARARLARIGSVAIPALASALKDNSECVRGAAVWALGAIGDPVAIDALRAALGDEDAWVRSEIVRALEKFGQRAPVQLIIERLRDDSSHVRQAAAHALGEIANPEAVDALLGAIADPDGECRKAVVEALAATGHPSAIPALIERLEADAYVPVRYAALRMLGRMKASEAAEQLAAITQDDNSTLRNDAFRALKEIGDAQVVAQLFGILHNPDARNRNVAAYLLGEIGDDTAAPGLADALKDQNPDVRLCAAQALGRLRPVSAVQALIQALQDPEEKVRNCVRDALGEIATPEAKAALKSLRSQKPAEA